MPVQSADWQEVQATAVLCGSIKEAAEAHGVSYQAARQRAKREHWPVGQRPARTLEAAKADMARAVATVAKKPVTSVTTGPQAALNVLARRDESSRLSLSKYVVRASARAATTKSSQLLAEAANVKAIAGVHAQVWPRDQPANAVLVNLNLLGLDLDQASATVISPDLS